MAALPSYKIANGGTFKMMPEDNPVKVSAIITLKNSQGVEKTFYHEIESIDVDAITAECERLTAQYEMDTVTAIPAVAAEPQLQFNVEISVDPASVDLAAPAEVDA